MAAAPDDGCHRVSWNTGSLFLLLHRGLPWQWIQVRCSGEPERWMVRAIHVLRTRRSCTLRRVHFSGRHDI